jgi:hypothetical protein
MSIALVLSTMWKKDWKWQKSFSKPWTYSDVDDDEKDEGEETIYKQVYVSQVHLQGIDWGILAV